SVLPDLTPAWFRSSMVLHAEDCVEKSARKSAWRLNMKQGVEAMKRTGMMLLALTLWLAPATGLAADAEQAANPVVAAATAEDDTSAAMQDEATLPDNGVHRVKAPDIDIAGLRDPFESYLTVLDQQNKERMHANRSRTPDHEAQPLEGFDLGALKLVAIMKMGGSRAAMVEDPEGKGYVVRTGTYIGRDNGRVVNISERSVEIMEDEFTATGEIAKRKAALTLNEVNQ
ncbi:MAG TPA: hypothetical protein DIW28_09045, partial [Zetaproteobacteria bacterium]|nr:hypothetical protein [Zetaproteobacteria bacterium]